MGWGDIRYCFAMAILVTSPRLLSGDVLLFYLSLTDSDFFGLSRSTRCGCCSYQVSSISVWRVICYDHFCVFQFFSILAVSMATAAILKK
jgi:hypothetical protein